VIGATTDPLNENLGQVLVTNAEVEPGSSGSAVLDADGRVVGVVYAKNSTGQSFVVPVSTLRQLLTDETAFAASTTCTGG
jgi:S1-C subfamily serine protease